MGGACVKIFIDTFFIVVGFLKVLVYGAVPSVVPDKQCWHFF